MNGSSTNNENRQRPWSGAGYPTPRIWFWVGWLAVLAYLPTAIITAHKLSSNTVALICYGIIGGLITGYGAWKTKSIIMIIMAVILVFNIPIVWLVVQGTA